MAQTRTYLPRATRNMIALSIMAAAIMNQIDTTIANVALPHIQGTTSASREQISWVLTSYIIAMAITTPLTGWLADRYGRKRLMTISVLAFTAASGLCGISTNLNELILFRILQGMAGSSLLPIAQVVLMDVNPPEERGKSMAIFGLGFIMGPLAGPLLGGWLTQNFSWHWVFLINLPIGVLAFLGISAYLPDTREDHQRPFDLFGFALLVIGVGAFQLMIDRGQLLDWFESTEICVTAGISALALYLFAVHIKTAANPFVRLEIFSDRNFAVCTALGFFVGVLMFGTMSVVPPMLAGLFGEPIMKVGIAMAPRGFGTFAATMVVGRMIGKVDLRLLVLFGLLASAASSMLLAGLSLAADDTVILAAGFISGFAMSFLFVPLSSSMFATLPRHYLNEASAVSTLIRYVGSAAGISLVQLSITRNAAQVQSRVTEGVTPDNPVLALARPDADFSTLEGMGRMVGEVARQALMVAYVDTFWVLGVMCLVATPLVLLLRRSTTPSDPAKLPEISH